MVEKFRIVNWHIFGRWKKKPRELTTSIFLGLCNEKKSLFLGLRPVGNYVNGKPSMRKADLIFGWPLMSVQCKTGPKMFFLCLGPKPLPKLAMALVLIFGPSQFNQNPQN